MCKSARGRIDRTITKVIDKTKGQIKCDLSYKEAKILEHKLLVLIDNLIEEEF